MKNNIFAVIALTLVVTSLTFAAPPKWEWRPFMDAIRQVETGGLPNGGLGAIGDKGKAIGPYQIHKVCWIDAVKFDPSLAKGKYEDCLNDREYSEKVLRAYITRYLPEGGSPEDAARIWNGGPKGHKKSATLKYAEKFRRIYTKELERILRDVD